MDFIHEGGKDLKGLFNRFKKRDFSGDTGQTIKNSSYQLAQNLVFKIGSLIFTIIVARILLPDLMGLYNLALTTIILISSFSDLGIGSALITFCSKNIGNKKYGKAKGYLKKLFEWKIYLLLISSLMILGGAYFISEFYYQKPIFYALLVGGIYIPVLGLIGFFEQVFKSEQNFRIPLFKEILFQISRMVIVPLAILLFISSSISPEKLIPVVLLSLIFAYSLSLLYLFKFLKRVKFLKTKSEKLNSLEIKELKKFIYPLSATAMTGLFFGYTDTLMLGHFISAKFIAYYIAAFSLVGGATAIIGFMASAMIPIFARKQGKELENIFKKTRNFSIFISLLAGIFTYFVSWYVVKLTYGVEYLPASQVLKLFSVLVFLLPISGIYEGYFTTQKRTKELAILLVGSTILNVILNFIGITYGLNNFGEMGAVYGACFATILSRIIYLGGLVIWRGRVF